MNINSFLSSAGFVKHATPIDIMIDPRFLWVGLGGVALLFTIVSLILIYHWIAYGYRPITTGVMAAVYLSLSFVIFSVMLVTIVSYSATI